MSRSTRVFKTPPAETLRGSAMPPETTDLFEVEHIEYVADRSVDEVASHWRRPLAIGRDRRSSFATPLRGFAAKPTD